MATCSVLLALHVTPEDLQGGLSRVDRCGRVSWSHGQSPGFAPLLLLFQLCLFSGPLTEHRLWCPHDMAPGFPRARLSKASFPRGPGSCCEAENNTTWKAQNVTSAFHSASGPLGPVVVQRQETRLHPSWRSKVPSSACHCQGPCYLLSYSRPPGI